MADCASLGSFLAILLLLLSFLASQIRSESKPLNDNDNDRLISELEDMKLKVTRLESILEETTQTVEARIRHLTELEKLTEDMENKIQYLHSALLSITGCSSHDERVTALEEEVQLLWAASRKNNFDLHILHSKVEDAEDRLDVVSSQVDKMADIVTEQWIQIQQLEQALQVTKVRTMETRAKLRLTTCIFFKFKNSLSGKHLSEACRMFDEYPLGKESTLSSYVSRALQLLKRSFSAAREYHHELQRLVRQEMDRNEYTAALANKEVVFFVASAIITFPILGAWMILCS